MLLLKSKSKYKKASNGFFDGNKKKIKYLTKLIIFKER